MATNVSVTQRKNESAERLIRRFIKKCKKEKIVEEYRDRMTYVPPSEKRREKRKRAKRAQDRENKKQKRMIQRYLGDSE
jgi:ribosomal protein S21